MCWACESDENFFDKKITSYQILSYTDSYVHSANLSVITHPKLNLLKPLPNSSNKNTVWIRV